MVAILTTVIIDVNLFSKRNESPFKSNVGVITLRYPIVTILHFRLGRLMGRVILYTKARSFLVNREELQSGRVAKLLPD